MTDDRKLAADDLARAIAEIVQLVAHGRQGCLALRTLLASSDGPAGVVAGVQFVAHSLETTFERIDEALGDIARIEASAGELPDAPA